jgi:hypothetical protein
MITAKVTSKGQVTIPKEIREKLGVHPGEDGETDHVLADFLIGAHALVRADCILSRDLGVYKTYFRDLKLIGSL